MMGNLIAEKLNVFEQAKNPEGAMALYILEFTKKNGRLPDAEDLATIAAYVLKTFDFILSSNDDDGTWERAKKEIANSMGIQML